LRKLTAVNLNGNECINENFDDQTKIESLQQVVSAKCAFIETPQLLAKFKALEVSINETLAENQILQSQNQKNAKQIKELQFKLKQKKAECLTETTNNTSLETELKAVQNEKIQLEAQNQEKAKQIEGLKANNTRLQADLKSAQATTDLVEAQAKLAQNLSEQLDTQRNETFATIIKGKDEKINLLEAKYNVCLSDDAD
jgi:septal ring factor EnvC (AmiA/AmiB activator)